MEQTVNLTAEMALLGAMMWRQECIAQVAELIEPEDFYREQHRRLFATIVDTDELGSGVDPVVLSEQSGVDAAEVFTIYQSCPVTGNWQEYTAMVREASHHRSLSALAHLTSEDLPAIEKVQRLSDGVQAVAKRLEEHTAAASLTLVELEKDPPPSVKHIVEGGILVEEGCLLLGGVPGGGKTLLAMDLGIALAQGSDFLGYSVSQPMDVLFLEQEGASGELFQRFERKTSGMSDEVRGRIHLPQELVSDIQLDTAQGLAEVRRLIVATGSKVVFMDPLVSFTTGSENDTEVAKVFTTNLRRLIASTGVSLVICHHIRKEQVGASEPLDAFRGSSVLVGYVDTAFLLKHDPERRSGYRDLLNAKLRHGPMLPELMLGLDATSLKFTREGTKAQPVEIEEKELYDYVAAHGPAYFGDIVEAFEGRSSEKTLRRKLKLFIDNGAMVKVMTKGRKTVYSLKDSLLDL